MSFHGGKLLLCDCGWRRLAPCPLSGDVSVWIGKCDPAMQGIEVGDVVVVSPGPPAIAGCYTVTGDVQRETPGDPIVSGLVKIDDPDGCASELCSPPCPPNCVHCPDVLTLSASINANDCISFCDQCGSCGPYALSGTVQMIRQGNNCIWQPDGWIVEPETFDEPVLCAACQEGDTTEQGTEYVECVTSGSSGFQAGNITCGVIGVVFEPFSFIYGWAVTVGLTLPSISQLNYGVDNPTCAGQGQLITSNIRPCPYSSTEWAPSCTFLLPLAGPMPCPIGAWVQVSPGDEPNWAGGGCAQSPANQDCVTGTLSVS